MLVECVNKLHAIRSWPPASIQPNIDFGDNLRPNISSGLTSEEVNWNLWITTDCQGLLTVTLALSRIKEGLPSTEEVTLGIEGHRWNCKRSPLRG
ncbi:hypothetical protein OUZ56_015495 [Daphnia magna]|uniref:Uncharacterized protein n=1 Tax=Daphnia magna TaxID=35525 RepID=A0ABR0AMZ6_9CRUS|nr:hypothetical protein OUZ56_015495 [Daphnia magna]